MSVAKNVRAIRQIHEFEIESAGEIMKNMLSFLPFSVT